MRVLCRPSCARTPKTPHMPSECHPPAATALSCFLGPAPRRRRKEMEQRGDRSTRQYNHGQIHGPQQSSSGLGRPRRSSAPLGVPTPFPGTPSPGGSTRAGCTRGHPQHPVEILALASIADGDKDKTTPWLINKRPDSAASIRQAIPEPARPNPQLRAGIAARVRQPARGAGSGKRRSVPASPFTWGWHECRRRRRSDVKRRQLEETGSPPGDGITDRCKRENKRPIPPTSSPIPIPAPDKGKPGHSSAHANRKPPRDPRPAEGPPSPTGPPGISTMHRPQGRDAQTETRGPQ